MSDGSWQTLPLSFITATATAGWSAEPLLHSYLERAAHSPALLPPPSAHHQFFGHTPSLTRDDNHSDACVGAVLDRSRHLGPGRVPQAHQSEEHQAALNLGIPIEVCVKILERERELHSDYGYYATTILVCTW
jgi:hypothetical protein